MSNWAIQYPINFTANGDATNTAIQKHINEITSIYGYLNLLKSSFIGTTAPSSPNAGQFWMDTSNASTTGAILKMRDYANANWITLFTVASNSIPAVANPVQGDILYYAGDGDTEGWQLLSPGVLGQYLQTQGGAANPLWSSIALSFGTIVGLSAVVKTASSILITASNNPFTGAYTALSLTLSAGGTGANALDVGSITANTWYYHFLIYGTKGIASLLSLSANAPTLPPGYSQFIRTGAVVTDSSAALRYTAQAGRRVRLLVTQRSRNDDSFRIISNSAQGSYDGQQPSYSAISIDNRIPPTASIIRLTLSAHIRTSSGVFVAPNGSYGGAWFDSYTDDNVYPAPLSNNESYTFSGVTGDLLLESRYLYVSSETNGMVFLDGWEDNL
jgi:hypothetical protein